MQLKYSSKILFCSNGIDEQPVIALNSAVAFVPLYLQGGSLPAKPNRFQDNPSPSYRQKRIKKR
jgi:hypothetical protein